MGTYIIHFDDKPWEDLDDEQYYRCKEIPWFSTTKTTISRLTPYTEPDLNSITIYQKGLSDLWEAVWKIYSMCSSERHKIFGENYILKILSTYSASEAIEKVRAYEQEKEEFHVGDEFENESGKRFVILKMDGAEIDRYIDEEGKTYCMSQKYNVMRKTGRKFSEIVEVLRKMKEAE